MPLIKSRYSLPEGLVSIENKGDKTIFTHATDVGPVAESCKELRKDPDKCISEDGTMQLVARIPELVFFANPQLTEPSGKINWTEMRKFLHSPDGELFRTAAGNI